MAKLSIGVVSEVKSVQLTLSIEEALVLYKVLTKISGCPERSLRRYTDSIRKELSAVGISYRDTSGMLEGGIGMPSGPNEYLEVADLKAHIRNKFLEDQIIEIS